MLTLLLHLRDKSVESCSAESTDRDHLTDIVQAPALSGTKTKAADINSVVQASNMHTINKSTLHSVDILFKVMKNTVNLCNVIK